MNTRIISAIENKNLIEFIYENETRIVEPHCYGKTTAGNEALRAYQIAGFSSSGKLGWKMYDLSKAKNINIRDDKFDAPRIGYKRGDKGMSDIFAEL